MLSDVVQSNLNFNLIEKIVSGTYAKNTQVKLGSLERCFYLSNTKKVVNKESTLVVKLERKFIFVTLHRVYLGQRYSIGSVRMSAWDLQKFLASSSTNSKSNFIALVQVQFSHLNTNQQCRKHKFKTQISDVPLPL